ncbi:hypothetical protein AYI70_g3061 [Smittium culicis]|uniref:Uncharacterized protein n=1 Tax=Smittium culicis TaxID=133412 RepID=A0A1R1Y5J7_9FUNG|nr:hypothetical protein AYI70_g3061 [Smittium culicis]
MEQIAELQSPAIQDQVKVLTKLVQQLLRKNERNQEPEDPYVTTRTPVTDLTAYSELTEALPSIKKDFFRSPLTEEERKIAIHSFPRTSSMNYNPPPLNDSASTAVKKADTALYGIQVALAQATRPIDYFFHRRIQDNPGLDTSEDPEVMFASTMRALLSDVATTVTQARLDNLHKGLKLPGKPTQLVDPETKPLMDQEALDALISKKSAAKRQCFQPFRKRQQSSNNKNSISINIATAQSTNASTTAEANSSNRTAWPPVKFSRKGSRPQEGVSLETQNSPPPMGSEHSREGIQNPFQELPPCRSGIEVVRYENSAESRIFAGDDLDSGAAPISKGALRVHSKLLHPAVHDPEKDWKPQTSLRPPQAQPKCGGAELQDGDPVVHLPHGPQKRIFYVLRPTGCTHAYPVSGPTIRVITEPVGFHQDSSPSLTMGQVPRNANLSIFGRPTNHGRIQRGINDEKSSTSPYQSIYTSEDGNKHPGNDAEGFENQDTGPLTRGQQNSECWPDDIEMSSELYWESSSNVNRSPAWPPNASTTPGAQEILPVDIENMDFDSETDESSHPEPIILEEPAEIMERVGDCGRLSNILRIIDTIRGEDVHKRQGTDYGFVCTQAKECDRTDVVSLLGQHNHAILSKEIRRNDFTRTARNSRENLVTLLEDQYSSSSDLCPISTQSSRCSEQTDSSNRMVSASGDIRNSKLLAWPTRCGSISLPDEQEDRAILQLVHRQPSSGAELTSVQMDGVQQSLCVPTLESDCANRAEGAQGTNNDDFSYANARARSQKRKVSALGKQALELDGLEDQRRFLETQGLGTYAVDCTLSKE